MKLRLFKKTAPKRLVEEQKSSNKIGAFLINKTIYAPVVRIHEK